MSQITLHVDFETASRVDLKTRGLDNYAKDPSTHVLMMAWACNDAPPQMWFPHEGPFPEHLALMIQRPEIEKAAYNSEFERTIFSCVLGIQPSEGWTDPMINSRYASIAGDLAFVGKVLGIEEDKTKLAAGKKLIKLFCEPNRKGEFNTHETHPTEWADFVEYCKRDVIAEREIGKKLRAFSLPPLEQRIRALDIKINSTGLPCDMEFVRKASKIVEEERAVLTTEFTKLTGLENPNSVKQLLGWLKEQNYPFGSLGAKWIKKALGANDGVGFGVVQMSEIGRRGLQLRQLLAKSSTSKLEALSNLVSADGRLRNQYVYGGAARTLRWSGRGFQPQNLPRPTIKKIPEATQAILTGDREQVRKFGPPLEVVASCLRGALCAPPGKRFVVCDLSSIEVIVLGWLANCPGILSVFEEGKDPYVDFGTRMFGLPYEQLDPEVEGISPEEKKSRKEKRQLSKPAVLGAGYGLGGGKEDVDKNGDEIKTGLLGYAESLGVNISQELAQKSIDIYRQSYPEIPAAWRRWENAAITAVRTGENQNCPRLTFGCVKPCKLLWIALPSGRRLHYIRPKIELTEKWDGEFYSKLSYEGQIIGAHWGRIPTWGGRITENLVQAIARDVLAHGMLKATEAGFTIVGTSHDEILCIENINSQLNVAKLRECMISRPTWASDLALNAAGFEAERYKKD
jgi:DNA polymerase